MKKETGIVILDLKKQKMMIPSIFNFFLFLMLLKIKNEQNLIYVNYKKIHINN